MGKIINLLIYPLKASWNRLKSDATDLVAGRREKLLSAEDVFDGIHQ